MLSLRIGLGPVFVYEWKTATRRWQAYALRTLFVSVLLLALVSIWMNTNSGQAGSVVRYLASLGEGFFLAVISTELTMVLVAAPAATAGTICLDRARGTLSHMLLTDLSAAEIVLGKLAARLIPVLATLACAFPVLEIISLLGGVDPTALLGGFAITAGIAVLGCSLALALSLWVGKTHEALVCTYAIWLLWLLARPMSGMLVSTLGWTWFMVPRRSEPFFLALAPYWWPGSVSVGDYLLFLGVTCLISALLIAATILRLRALCTHESARKVRRRFSPAHGGNLWRVLTAAIPRLTPSLDGNPVLWREWRRSRPSRGMMFVAGIYGGLSLLFSVLTILWPGGASGALVNGFQVAVGLLLLSVTAATSLSEERVRGSLDLLLSTPLSTRQIVMGKWLGAFRMVPLLAIMPALVIAAKTFATNSDRWWLCPMMIGFVFSAGAAITGLGLAMATRFARVGAAVGWTVAVYVLVTGGVALFALMFGPHSQKFIEASPLLWAFMATIEAGAGTRSQFSGALMFWTIFYALGAVALVLSTFIGFDRRLGRIDDAATWLCQPSRVLRTITVLYFIGAVCFAIFVLMPTTDATLLPFGTGLIFSLGLLLLGASASWPLAGGGSLTAAAIQPTVRQNMVRILLAKWARAARLIPGVLMVPLMIAFSCSGPYSVEMTPIVILLFFMLGASLAAVSLGVAMFAWFNRGAWALGITALLWALLNTASMAFGTDGLLDPNNLAFSSSHPFTGVAAICMWISEQGIRDPRVLTWALISSLAYAAAAGILLLAAVLTVRGLQIQARP